MTYTYYLMMTDRGPVIYRFDIVIWQRYEPVLSQWQDAGSPPDDALLFEMRLSERP